MKILAAILKGAFIGAAVGATVYIIALSILQLF